MQIPRLLWLFVSIACLALAEDTSKYTQSVKLSYTILGTKSPSAKQLAEVLYDPQTLKYHLSSWTPPSTDSLKSTSQEPENSQLVRISVPDGSSSVTTLSAFDPSISQYIELWLSATSDKILSASISSVNPPPLNEEQIRQKRKEERARAKGKEIPKPKPKPKAPKPKKGKKVVEEPPEGGAVVQVNLYKQANGPQPKLISRKPPQTDSEGKEVPQEEQQEKTFFQKYWWIFLAGTLLMMTGGGGK